MVFLTFQLSHLILMRAIWWFVFVVSFPLFTLFCHHYCPIFPCLSFLFCLSFLQLFVYCALIISISIFPYFLLIVFIIFFFSWIWNYFLYFLLPQRSYSSPMASSDVGAAFCWFLLRLYSLHCSPMSVGCMADYREDFYFLSKLLVVSAYFSSLFPIVFCLFVFPFFVFIFFCTDSSSSDF